MADRWQTVASLPPLEPGEVQVWRIDLAEIGESNELPDIYKRDLSNEELDRADRLRAGLVRLQFVVARACLRGLLGNLSGLSPEVVPITLSAYGKPEIAPIDGRPVFFNVAHSRTTVLVALCREGRVGVDLEYLDRETDILEVARASFMAAECRQIEGVVDAAQRRRAFFQCWTRKEAVVKADGRGLSLPLNCFEVPVRDSVESSRVEVDEPRGLPEGGVPAGTWLVTDLALGEEIAGAIAVDAGPLRLRTLRLPLGAEDAPKLKALSGPF